jgi:hypothetical protein
VYAVNIKIVPAGIKTQGVSMKTKRFFVFGLSAVLLALGLVLAGCPTGGGDNGPGSEVFIVAGSFTKTGDAGNGVVKFTLESNDAFSGTVTADSYTVSGVLEDGDLTIRLKGSYDPNTGIWSASAKSSTIIYTLDGNVDNAGVLQGASATIAVKSGNEWVPHIFPVTEEAVSIPGAAAAEESEAGLPSFAKGYWYSKAEGYGGVNSVSLSVLVSDWKSKVTGTYTSPDGTMSIDQSWTLVEYTGSGSGPYEVIACYPEYVITSENLAKAVAAYLGVPITAFIEDEEPSGRYVGVSEGAWFGGGFSEAEWKRLRVFHATGGWEKWAAKNNVTKENRYVKAKMSYSNNTRFDMINMVKVEPWGYTYYFPTLATLKAATLVEEHNWDWSSDPPTDLGVQVFTFTR